MLPPHWKSSGAFYDVSCHILAVVQLHHTNYLYMSNVKLENGAYIIHAYILRNAYVD